MHDGFIRKEKTTYFATPKPFFYDREHYDAVTATRNGDTIKVSSTATDKKFTVESAQGLKIEF